MEGVTALRSLTARQLSQWSRIVELQSKINVYTYAQLLALTRSTPPYRENTVDQSKVTRAAIDDALFEWKELKLSRNRAVRKVLSAEEMELLEYELNGMAPQDFSGPQHVKDDAEIQRLDELKSSVGEEVDKLLEEWTKDVDKSLSRAMHQQFLTNMVTTMLWVWLALLLLLVCVAAWSFKERRSRLRISTTKY